jgi:hypothetical protein
MPKMNWNPKELPREFIPALKKAVDPLGKHVNVGKTSKHPVKGADALVRSVVSKAGGFGGKTKRSPR